MDKLTGIISSAELMGGQIVGMRGLKGDKGDTGNGIASIAKTGTSGDIDTYTITFTDGDTTTFNVTNGHTPVITQVPVATDLWTGTAIYVDGVYLTTIMDGAKGDKGDTGATGATGNGIASITLTDTTGSVKTYTITFTNGDTTTFQVTDGEVTNAILEKVLPTDTKSGSIASFPDGTDLFPALSCVADIDPVQDLHGYDAPWVGGAGKNKVPPFSTNSRTDGDIIFTQNADGTVTVNGTASQTAIWREQFTFEGGSYIISGGLSANNFFGIQNADSTYVARSFGGDTSFNLAAGTYYKTVRIGSGETVTNAVFKPMVRLSTETDATYAPYSNICPISGWSEVNATVNGINQWDEEWENGYYNRTTGAKAGNSDTTYFRSKNFIPCVPNTSYYFTKPSQHASNTTWYAVLFYDVNKNFISATNYVAQYPTQTTPANAYYMTIYVEVGTSGATYNNDISINYPSTDHDYHAYNGTTYTVSWSGDAGTVYGGTVDVVSGELTVTHAIVDMGDLNWVYSSGQNSYFYSSVIADFKFIDNNAVNYICSAYESYSVNERYKNGYVFINSAKQAVVVNENYTNASTFKTDMTGQKIVYELATPTTYTLTPAQVDLLVGQNTVFADTGDVTVEYKADIQRYIAKKLAE